MVRKLMLGARQHGKAIVVVLALVALGLILVLSRRTAAASWTYSSLQVRASMVTDCACTGGCSSMCSGPTRFPEGVSPFDLSIAVSTALGSEPGRLAAIQPVLTWDARVDWVSQFGRDVLCNLQITAEKTILNSGNPNGPSGHEVTITYPSVRQDVFVWNGSAYTTSSCGARTSRVQDEASFSADCLSLFGNLFVTDTRMYQRSTGISIGKRSQGLLGAES